MTAASVDTAPPGDHSQRLALAALVFGALAIGAAPIFVRLSQTGPAATGFWRLVFALPILVAMSVRREGGIGKATPANLAAGLMFALDLACWHYGIRFTSVANATVLPNLTPVLVTLAAWLLFKERPRGVFLLGLAVAVGGAVVMALANAGAGAVGTRPHLGDALSISTAFWYGLYFVAVRQARTSQSATRVMTWSSLAGAPILLLVAVVLKEPLIPTDPMLWGPLAALGLVHVLGQGSIAWALGRLPTATAALVVLVQPVAAALLAFLVFGEAMTPVQALGGVLALAGVVIAQWKGKAAPTEAAEA
ncbi:DMT family transporter [Caulobacter sp. KR2-114]|uniref:DMT family transporter n=1 Tax=Caulobacter sp. KR2-114 TaxID=3400912 RepID=UPI003C0225CF